MHDFIIKIGPLFWVLCAFAVYALAVIAERILFFHRSQISTGEFLRGITRLVRDGKTAEARHEAGIIPVPAARVVCAVLAYPTLPREELHLIAQEAAQREIFPIEKHIRGLLVVATLSTLTGMLGTVQGLIGFYAQPGVLDGTAPSLAMSHAIYQALLSSALGLTIAIPAYLFYSYLAACARKMIYSLECVGTETVCLLCDVQQSKTNGTHADSAS